MARPDISRRTTVREREVPQEEFYETMPMTAAPTGIVREQTEDIEYNDSGLLIAERVVAYIAGAVEAVLGIRLILTLFAYAGIITTANSFARFIYQITNPLIAPFVSLFNTSATDPGAWTIVFAMFIYALVGYGIAGLFRLGRPREQ